jgi:glycosyltransferase involved in cell wall biosynthesis
VSPRAFEVLIVSGIWPPDVGGPASHGPELGAFLSSRGHRVRAVTSAGRERPDPPAFPLRIARRDRPVPVRLVGALAALSREAATADVIYATGMTGRSSVVSGLRRVPLVAKVVSDEAYERSRRLGLYDGSLEEFQRELPGARIRALKFQQRLLLSRASCIVIPSEYLARIARGWGLPADRITVIPNPAPPVEALPSREVVRGRLGLNGPTFVFAGRLVPQKNLPLAVTALRAVPDASLVIIGDGSEQSAVLRAAASAGVENRVSLQGPLPRSSVMEWLHAADAAVLPSDWENFPHAAVEALAVGTPVIATAVGGVPEIVEADVNGLLVPPGDLDALTAAMRSVATDAELLGRLRDGAAASSGRFSQDASFAALEGELERAAGL